MFLHELCGSWMEHPFWRNAFVIKDPADIRRIIDSGIEEVMIDTAKGLDVLVETPIAQPPAPPAPTPPAPSVRKAERVSMADEMKQAAKVVTRSKQAVTSMFQEARMGKALDAADAAPLVDEIASSVSRNPGAIISLARLKNKDEYTYMHSVAVCALMVALARQLGLNDGETRDAGLAGLLHDVGKMAIDDLVLNKPGALTDAEFTLVKSHPEEGHKMLLEGKNISPVALDVCLHHHEKIDGRGYPHRLQGDAISLYAKMGAVCDVYDAVTSNRPYKAGWDPAESVRKMAEWAGHFDQRVFQAFIKSIGIYPVGSLVRLESGRLGVVIDQTDKSLLTPKLRVFFSTRSNLRIPPEVVDLSRPEARDKIAGHEDPGKWNFTDLSEMMGSSVELWG